MTQGAPMIRYINQKTIFYVEKHTHENPLIKVYSIDLN